ncbi:uncharacterized protein LOC126354264 isoform X1 [Schistocerca gregaria]|uniref:uncharacterized protein LOC126354264 isoform X1 n=2 Tax=Schistocerca gregaria TaxID=7010 RepID=UPI00211EA757|nr:uncharacterized protein LOC126354264 isoform X1 [Schistocerca gregaria]
MSVIDFWSNLNKILPGEIPKSPMDLAETMKNIVAKGIQTEMGPPFAGAGYVTEKLYMLLQLYLQNKGWNPSVELLQCFSELKEASMLPSAAYLQMMASRVALDAQGRLILRENGKIILPYEHFANAVMLKHMNGPHGLHLGLEGTIRAVMESYTIGRECFGMEKEFIVDVVQNCPNAACRYYKNQLELTQKGMHLSAPTYIPDSAGGTSQLNPSVQEAAANLLRSAAYPSSAAGAEFGVPLPLHHPVEMGADAANKKAHHKQQKTYEQVDSKLADFLRANLENLEGFSSANKDLLALHNGAWPNSDMDKRTSSGSEGGQEKIVRAFTEIMKNMSRMKTCIRPAMCKPYGKQSEALQKTLVDTIQLVQSLRSFLPPPHIAVSSWKNEDKHRKTSMEDLCESTVRKID